MHKIDSPNADAANEFRDGDPATGVVATELWSKWFNTVQRELVAIPAAAEIALDDEDDTQVLQGILALISTAVSGIVTSTGNRLATDYGRLNLTVGGETFVLQWDTRQESSGDGVESFDFPYEFANACIFAYSFIKDAEVMSSMAPHEWTVTSYAIDRENIIDGTRPFVMFAIGY